MYKFILFTLFLAVQPALSKINSLSPWSLQGPTAIEERKIVQSLQLQVGINGVSPMGGDTDAKFYSLPYQISYGLPQNLELGMGLGAQVLQRKGRGAVAGISDIALAAKYRILEVNPSEKQPGADLEFGFSIPVASYERALGTGALGILFQWGIVLPTEPLKSYFGAGYRYFQENSDGVQVGSVLSYYIGITRPRGDLETTEGGWKTVALNLELKGFSHSRSKTSGREGGLRPDEFYIVPGITLKRREYSFTGTVLGGLTKESSDFGINIEMNF